jgi:ATP-binding cassette subfamily F protein uup
LHWARLEQKLADESEELVRDFVARGMSRQLARINEFERLTAVGSDDRAALREIEALKREIDAGGGWSIDVCIATTISELGLPGELRLSGSRRPYKCTPVPCCSSLTIVASWRKSPLGSSTSIAAGCAVDPAATTTFWSRKHEARKPGSQEAEDHQNALFDKKLAEEEIWIRKGVKARQTRNEGRVRALEELREIRAARVKRPRSARVQINESDEVSGRKVIELRNVSHGYGGHTVLKDFSLRVMRGD